MITDFIFCSPAGNCTVERSQTGAAAMLRLSWTFVASMLKYVETVSRDPGCTASRFSDGQVGAAILLMAPSAVVKSIEERILKGIC